MRPFEYIPARSATEAVQAANSNRNARYLGGGTNIIDLMKEDVERPAGLIYVAEIPFNRIKATADGGLSLGAMVSNTDTANHPEVRKNYPLLTMAMLSAATEQIRNMATNGGNLLQRTRCPYFYETSMPCNKREPGTGCGALKGVNTNHAVFGWSEKCVAVHPSDMCVALAAIGATVEVEHPVNGSRSIAFSAFHRLPGDEPEKDTSLQAGELITAIVLPKVDYADHYYYLKIRERSSYAFALVSVAAGLQIRNDVIAKAGLAMGGVAHKPWKLSEAEEYLEGKKPSRENFEKAADLAFSKAKPLSDNTYKLEMGKKAIVRTLMQAMERND